MADITCSGRGEFAAVACNNTLVAERLSLRSAH